MKNILIITVLAFLSCLCLPGLQAQNTTATSGGEATGNGGNISYTVGQTFYNIKTGYNAYVVEGVQQPYEISVISNKKDQDVNPDLKIYPNPTSSYLILDVGNNSTKDLNFRVYDIDGKQIQNKDIEDIKTKINLKSYSSGNYFLKVFKGNKEIKSFKIIKNL